MKRITQEHAGKLLAQTNGRFFSVGFTKADGSNRVLNGRTGVHKYVKGKGLAFDPLESDLLPVFDVQKDAFRMVNLATLKLITFAGKTFRVV